MLRGSKIIILSRLKTLDRFRSVKPIFLSAMSSEKLKYLLKTLAFGSVDPTEHPQLVKLADEFGKLLHNVPDTLIAINILADVLRMNLNVQYWLCILDKGLRYIKRNLSTYGVQPSMLLEEDHRVDIKDFALPPRSMIPCTANFSIKKELPSLTLGELIRDSSVTPKQDFIIIAWESSIPPSSQCYAETRHHFLILLQVMVREHMKLVPCQGGSEEECQFNFVSKLL